MKNQASSLIVSNIIKLHGKEWLENQRVAGKVVAQCLNFLQDAVKNKTRLTAIELSEAAESIIVDNNCTPTFKNYKGFPAAVCISVNKELVHGIPKNQKFKDGDVISFDLGATYKGSIADSAITVIYGEGKSEHTRLIRATEESLMKGISAISMGKRIGSIGHAIYQSARNNGYSVVEQYGGHGLSISDSGEGIPHAPPFVCNKADYNDGIRITAGLAIAIEPLLGVGDTRTSVASDNWTVMSESVFAHFEHSVFVHSNHVEIMTYRGNENYLKSNKIYFEVIK